MLGYIYIWLGATIIDKQIKKHSNIIKGQENISGRVYFK